MRQKYILVIVDNKDYACNFQAVLNRYFSDVYDVCVVHSGRSALRFMRMYGERVALILLDLSIVDMRVGGLCDEIESFSFAYLPPILGIAVFLDEMIDFMAGRKIFDCLFKSCSDQALIEACCAALSAGGGGIEFFSKNFMIREIIYRRNMFLMSWYKDHRYRYKLTDNVVLDYLISTHQSDFTSQECMNFLDIFSNDTQIKPIARWIPLIVYIKLGSEGDVFLERVQQYSSQVIVLDDFCDFESYLKTSNKPDILLLDLSFDTVDIASVLNKMKTFRDPFMEMIVVSNLEIVSEIKSVLKIGVDKFLKKTILADDFIEELDVSFNRLYVLKAMCVLISHLQNSTTPFSNLIPSNLMEQSA